MVKVKDSLVWQQLLLSQAALTQWYEGSYLYHWVGLLRAWRSGSWLMQGADLIGVGLVSLVLALAPFVPNALIGLLLLAIAGFWFLLTLSDDRQEAQFTPIHLLVLMYWTVSTVATAFSPVKWAAFSGWTKLTLYLLFFAFCARLLRKSAIRTWLTTLLLYVSVIVSVYGIRQWFFGAKALATWVDPTAPEAKTTRVYSYLGNPNLLAGYLLPMVILAIAAFLIWRGWMRKALAATILVVNGSCLVLTFSRGGWIGLVAAVTVFSVLLVFWLSLRLPPFWQKWSMPLVIGVIIAVVAFAVLFVPPIRDRVFSMFLGSKDSSNNFRLNVWAAVIDMIKDRPILGIGPGNSAFNRIYPLYQRPRFTALSAYSIVLEIAVETGLIGVFTFFWFLAVTLTQGWQKIVVLRNAGNREGLWLVAAIAIILGMLAHGTVDTVWYRPEVNTLWWFSVALIASFTAVPVQSPERLDDLPTRS